MPAMAPLPEYSPVLKAWEQYKQTDDFKNSRRWAAQDQHRDGSMWAAFLSGWTAAQSPVVHDALYLAAERMAEAREAERAHINAMCEGDRMSGDIIKLAELENVIDNRVAEFRSLAAPIKGKQE